MVFNFTAKVFLGYDSDKSSDDLSEKFNKILEGLMSLPLNIPGTAFHDCMKVMVDKEVYIYLPTYVSFP